MLTNRSQAFSRCPLEDKRSVTRARSLLCTCVENASNVATERATSQRVKFSVVSLAEHNDGRSRKPRIEPDMLVAEQNMCESATPQVLDAAAFSNGSRSSGARGDAGFSAEQICGQAGRGAQGKAAARGTALLADREFSH